jgi:hypothetical protein
MSANQLPRPGGGLTHHMARDRSRHDCPDCLRNGGHHVVTDEEAIPAWARPAKAVGHGLAPSRRKCAYWSARAQEHCGATDKIAHISGVGPRCPQHDPALTAVQYWAAITKENQP